MKKMSIEDLRRLAASRFLDLTDEARAVHELFRLLGMLQDRGDTHVLLLDSGGIAEAPHPERCDRCPHQGTDECIMADVEDEPEPFSELN